MIKTIKFHKTEEKMLGIRWNDSNFSDDLIIINKDNEIQFAHYDFSNKIFEDTTTWTELYGHDIIKNVKIWAYASDLLTE